MSAANAGITKSPEPSIEESEIMTTPQRPMVRLKTEVNSPLALEILSVKIEVDGFLDRERPHFVVKNRFNRMMIIVSQNQPQLWFWVEINDLRGNRSLSVGSVENPVEQRLKTWCERYCILGKCILNSRWNRWVSGTNYQPMCFQFT